jgi:hypothetical protein
LDFEVTTVGYQSDGIETDLTLSQLLHTIIRDDGLVASLAANIAADSSGVGTSVFMTYNPWNGTGYNPLYLYLGAETIKVYDVTNDKSSEFTGTIDRGRFGSMPQDHIGEVYDATSAQGGAMYIADYPLTMEGRYAELWMVPGDFLFDSAGKPFFIPASDSLDDSDNGKIYAGVVDGTHEDGTQVTIRTSSLDTFIQGNVLSQCPQAKVSASRKPNKIYIGPHNWWLSFTLEGEGIATSDPILACKDVDDITAGDQIIINGIAVIEGLHWFKVPGDLPSTYASIAAGINATVVLNDLVAAFLVDNVVLVVSRYFLPSSVTITFTQGVAGNLYSTVAAFGSRSGYSALSTRVVRSTNNDGQAPWTDVSEGLYTPAQIEGFFKDTINSKLPPPIRVGGIFTENESGQYVFTGSVTPPVFGKKSTLSVITQQGAYSSFMRDLGFTDLEYTAVKDTNEDYAQNFSITGSRRPAILRVPSSEYLAPARIYFDELDAFSRTWFANPEGLDDDGNPIDKMMQIKEVGLFTFDSVTTTDVGQRYATSVLRASPEFGVTKPEEYYLEYDPNNDKQLEVNRVWNLTNCSANRIMLFLMLSSSRGINDPDFDVGWPGCGLGIPSRFVDKLSFELLDTANPQKRGNYIIQPNDSARSIFDEELKATQQQIIADNGQLKLIEMAQMLEGLPKTTRKCGPSRITTDPERGIAVDRQANRIVNVVKVNAAYDYIQNKYYLNQINRKQDSIGTWGEKQSIDINIRGITNSSDGEARGKAIANQIFSIYSKPYAIFDVDIAVKEAWLWEVGDEVLLSHPSIPHPTSPRRGATDIPCKIIGKKSNFCGDSKQFVTLSLMSWALFGNRYTVWAPSVRITYAGATNRWNINETHYGSFLNGVWPSDYFQAGYRVRVHAPCNASVNNTLTINSRTGTPPGTVEITLSSGPGNNALTYIMSYAPYSDASLHEDQRKVAYASSGTGVLSRSSGTDRAFTYL